MQGNIKSYINAIVPDLPEEIISDEALIRLSKLAALFNDFAASEYILESQLNCDAAEFDFSLRVLDVERECLRQGVPGNSFAPLASAENWQRIIDFVNDWPELIQDIWLEMDYEELAAEIPQPCFFFNAERLVQNRCLDEALLWLSLKPLINPAQLGLLKKRLINVIQMLPPDVGLFQVGVMLARNGDRVRLFTNELTHQQIIDYLPAIGWTGSLIRLEEIFQLLNEFSERQYILDFDVTETGISAKIGINFGLENKENLPAFLDNLTVHQLCTDTKERGVLAWSGSGSAFLGPDYGFTVLIKDISHFKASYSPEEGLKVKAYLRFSGIYLKKMFAAPKHEQAQTTEKEVETVQIGYKEVQNGFKQIAKRSMLEKDFRELCLQDSQVAIQKVFGNDLKIPDNIIFMEEEPEDMASDQLVYILPPFLKPSWLTSK